MTLKALVVALCTNALPFCIAPGVSAIAQLPLTVFQPSSGRAKSNRISGAAAARANLVNINVPNAVV
jgi:hypothetical protein